jgi:hypothetical protein
MSNAVNTNTRIRHFLQISDFTREELLYVLDRAIASGIGGEVLDSAAS